jgi:hypothetical protein
MLVSFQNMNNDQDGCLSNASNQSQTLTGPMKGHWLDEWPVSCCQLRKKKKDSSPPVIWGDLKGLVTQAECWGVTTGHLRGFLSACWLSLPLIPRGPKQRKITHTGHLCLILQSFGEPLGRTIACILE